MKFLKSKWTVWVVLLALLCLAGLGILKKHISYAPDGAIEVRSDVLAYVSAAQNMLEGENIYLQPNGESNSYVYLPFLAWLLIPLTPLHPLAIDIGWFVLNLALVGMVIRSSYYLFRGMPFTSLGRGEQWLLASGTIVLSLRYLVRNAQDANVNLVICALIVGGIFMMRTRTNPAWAGLLGIAAAVKILPGIFVVYFAARKEWKAVAWLVGGALVASLLPITLIGVGRLVEYFGTFIAYSQSQLSPRGLEIENFSIWGLLGRLLSHNPAFNDGDGSPVFVNFAEVPLPYIRGIVYAISIALLLGLYRFAAREVRGGMGTEHGGVAVGLLVMNLVSILTEDHHTVSFMVATLYLLIPWREGRKGGRWSAGLALLAGLISLVLSYDVIVPLFGKTSYNLMLSYSLPVLPAGILLYLATYASARRRR